MSLCITTGAGVLQLAVTAFTLAWTHSVEKIRWEEDWRVTPAGLQITAARVRGSGAGMEPPAGAVLVDGWWRWEPSLAPIPELLLAASGATAGGWTLCAGGGCHDLGVRSGAPVRLAGCGGPAP